MKCTDCKYHSYVDGTHFCDSINHKRKTVRISDEETKKDIDCKWSRKEQPNGKRERRYRVCRSIADHVRCLETVQGHRLVLVVGTVPDMDIDGTDDTRRAHRDHRYLCTR